MASKTKGSISTGVADHGAEQFSGVPASTAPLYALVLISGAVLMGLEIVGSRLLAPYFGNSVFVWGSLISLFLIALSAGYYGGGRIADRYPSQGALAGIVAAVAVVMLLIPMAARPVCQAVLQAGLGEQSGPFLAAALLFLLPSVGMGMVSPFAIRLAAQEVQSLGRTAGTLYALSTAGSIAGTMLTTFVLIPTLGAGTILKGLAVALLVAGIAAIPRRAGSAGRAAAWVVVGAAAAFGLGESRAAWPLGSTVVEDANTPYHHLTVLDDGQGNRELRFDRYTESKIELAPPHRSLSEYTYYFHLAFLVQEKIERALFVGAGGGVGPRSFLMHRPAMEIDVVDIDQRVLDVARRHFFMTDEQQTRAFAADGRMFVRQASPQSYDAILLDAFTIGGRIPFHLTTREYFALCRERLRPGGVFVMNINSAETGPQAEIYHAVFRTLSDVFSNQVQPLVLHRGQLPPTTSTNIILVAARDELPADEAAWRARAENYESGSYVERGHIEQMLASLAPRPDVGEAPLLTDDYAPIETMSFD